MILKLIHLGNPVLRQKSQLIPPPEIKSPGFQKFIDDLIDTMHAAEGEGIAAVQVGVPKAVFVVEVKSNKRYPKEAGIPLQVFINPEVQLLKTGEEIDWEGCLSVPGLRGQVPRAKSLKIKALDRAGQPVSLEVNGFFARVIQHEWGHLQGRVYLDAMKGLETLTFLDEFARFWDRD